MGTVNVLEAVRATPTACARWSTSPPTSATRTASGSGPTARTSRWAGTTRTRAPRARGARHERLAAIVLLRPRGPRLASARAGNVIGGGDWGADRLIPDVMRAALAGRAGRDPQPGRDAALAARARTRSAATCMLAQALCERRRRRRPPGTSARARTRRARSAGSSSGSTRCGPAGCAGSTTPGEHPHEAHYLKVDSSRARARLGWAPRWDLERALERDRRLVRGAARRRGHARRHARRRSTPSRSYPDRAMTPDLPFLRRPARGDLRRPRHVAAGELLRRAGAAPTRWSRSIRCTRSCARVLPRPARASSRRRSTIFSRLRVLLVVLDVVARARRALRRGDDRALRPRTASSQVVEIASNDGYLLQYFVERGIPVLGIEPAANVAEVAEAERGVPTLVAFFGVETATRARCARRRPTCCSATTCSPTCPTSTTSSAA